MNRALVIGAGLSGATVARKLAEKGFKVTVIEKRHNVGGNAYDFKSHENILIQKYGPHLFHTNDINVFKFLSGFTSWYHYRHKVLGNIKGRLVPIPFNLNSIKLLFPKKKADRFISILTSEYELNSKVSIKTLMESENKDLQRLAKFIYKNVFYKYSKKQWGFNPKLLGEDVINRVPVQISFSSNYFSDSIQCMPTKGFAEMIRNMLNHKNIQVLTGTDAKEYLKLHDATKTISYENKEFVGPVIYTGSIDELFDYKYGKLPYRTLEFKFEIHDVPLYQEEGVINYNTSKKYTRISEFKYFTSRHIDVSSNATVVCKEYSKEHEIGQEPYYPISQTANQNLYNTYLLTAKSYHNLYFAGRLGKYAYMNMDAAVKDAIELSKQILEDFSI